MTDWSTYTDEELTQAANEIGVEQQRRHQRARIPQQMITLNKDWMATSEQHRDGNRWIRPTGLHDVYPKGWVVEHEGQFWVSTGDRNTGEPGKSGWHLESETEYPTWVQPTGAQDAYNEGDRVSHDEKKWRSNVNANTGEPGSSGAKSLWIEEVFKDGRVARRTG